MKKIVWDIEKKVAIPTDNIKNFEILNSSDSKFCVIARFVICTGNVETVFTSNSLEECQNFIESIYE